MLAFAVIFVVLACMSKKEVLENSVLDNRNLSLFLIWN